MTHLTHERGFVALMSVIIIGAILTVMMFTLGTSSFLSRFDALGGENAAASALLASGCVNAAELKLVQNPAYQPAVGGDCVTLGGVCGGADPQKVCKICQVTSGSPTTILTRSRYNGSYTSLSVTGVLGPNGFSVSNWAELPAYRGSPCALP